MDRLTALGICFNGVSALVCENSGLGERFHTMSGGI